MPENQHYVAYLKEIANVLNAHAFNKRFEVDSSGQLLDGGCLVKTKRLKTGLEAVKKDLADRTEKANWLLTLWSVDTT